MPVPHDTIEKLRTVFGSLSTLGASLDEAQWKSPTDLPGWSVQDNLSHLVGIERMLQGLPRADHTPPDAPHVKNPIGAANEIEVDSRRHLPGAAVLAEWDEIAASRLATLDIAGSDYFDAEAMTPTGPGTVADFLHIRVMDCWAHEQDMRRAVGMTGHLDGPVAEHSIDRLIRTLPIVIGKRAATPEGAAVAFDLTGPIERHLVFEVRNGRAGSVSSPTSEPVASVAMDSETFGILAFGRRPAAEMLDRVTLAGDTELARRIVDSLNMMI